MKQQFLFQKTDTLRLTIYKDNRPVVPADSVKITLYKPDGDTLQAEASASRDATTGEMTYALTTDHTADADLNYKAVWEYVVNGETYYESQLFDIVKSRLSIPITDDDLYMELESLRKANDQQTGTATAGAAGTLTDTLNRKEDDDYWTGGRISIISGTGSGQERVVTDFVQATSVISLSPTWSTIPDTTSVYRIIRSYTNQILRSFEKLQQMLYDKGRRHELIIESSQVKIPLIYLTVHFICLDIMDEESDKWSRLSEIYWKKFQDAFGDMKLEYDTDESGFIQGDEEQFNPSEVRIFRS